MSRNVCCNVLETTNLCFVALLCTEMHQNSLAILVSFPSSHALAPPPLFGFCHDWPAWVSQTVWQCGGNMGNTRPWELPPCPVQACSYYEKGGGGALTAALKGVRVCVITAVQKDVYMQSMQSRKMGIYNNCVPEECAMCMHSLQLRNACVPATMSLRQPWLA